MFMFGVRAGVNFFVTYFIFTDCMLYDEGTITTTRNRIRRIPKEQFGDLIFADNIVVLSSTPNRMKDK